MYAEGFERAGGKLARVADMNGFVSARTGLRFGLETGQLTVFGGDGRPLHTVEELTAEREAAERRACEQQERAARLAAKLRELGADPDAT
jgi:hypothetical protein